LGAAAGSGAVEDPVLTAVVTKILSPHSTGLELPRPGISVFQRTFCVSLQCSGASPIAMPSAAGPRQYGQSPFPAATHSAHVKNNKAANAFFIKLSSSHC